MIGETKIDEVLEIVNVPVVIAIIIDATVVIETVIIDVLKTAGTVQEIDRLDQGIARGSAIAAIGIDTDLQATTTSTKKKVPKRK